MILRCLIAAAAAWIASGGIAAQELKYVAIITRHGVRAPTWTPERLHQYSTSPWPDFGVPPGHLTPHGRTLMNLMGGFYRDYFLPRGVLGAPECRDSRRVYFWADTDQRTLETARAMAEAMLPGCKADIHSVPEGTSDPLFNPMEAGAVKQDAETARAAVTGQLGPRADTLIDVHRPAFDELVRILNGPGKAKRSIFDEAFGFKSDDGELAMTGPLRLASTLTENLLLEYTNGFTGEQLGWGRLNASNLLQVMSLHTTYADLMRRTPALAQARGSNLLSHVLRSLEQAATGKPVQGAIGPAGTSVMVISGHDTNISNLSGLLGMSWILPSHQPDDVPPGGALVFTLWRSNSGEYSVQTLFVGQTLDQMQRSIPLSRDQPPAISEVFLPGCSTAQAGYPCTWSRFQSTANGAIDPRMVK